MNAHWQFRVIILDSDFHDVRDHTRTPRSRPVIIGDRVWLGNRVTILPGVSIGDDSVIGAGTVVVKSVPSRSVAVGNPARVVKAL
jgi:maltose O-acetyltransferase